MAQPWTTQNIPDLHGKTVVITGANSGIGFETALALAGKGAAVTLAVRNPEKGQAAARSILTAYPQAVVEVLPLDLACLSSIRDFAAKYLEKSPALSFLINNAGVMAIPYTRTVDGFEMQFGTNHLGHFALTGLLLPALLAAPAARIITVSSINHNFGQIDFDNLDGSKKYTPFTAYNQSKLANLLFANELQRRFDKRIVRVISLACHPGYSATNLQSGSARMSNSRYQEIFWNWMNKIFAQSAAMGALPTIYAAVSPDVSGGDYIGPTSLFGSRGYPAKVRANPRAYEIPTAKYLWELSEEMTGVHYKVLETMPPMDYTRPIL